MTTGYYLRLKSFQLEFYFIQFKNNYSNTDTYSCFDSLQVSRTRMVDSEWSVAP